ncbi:MAG: type IX secretion system protein PorQ [Chitinophagales bacterium]|jgi:hypothetical protein|nr:type IX secretion system protein PorQ [Bacteroidota bacterium]
MRQLFILVLCSCFTSVFGQFGGSYTYAYLNLPPSARLSGLSGFNITTFDQDVNFGFLNPALLNEKMDGQLSASHAFIPSGMSQGYVAIGKQAPKWNVTMGGGILYRSYGAFELTDENGDRLGSFKASEYAANWGIGYGTGKLRYGANMKLLYANLESYSSFGIAADLGAAYIDTAHQINIGLVMRNIGTQIKPFVDNNYEELPFSIDIGISKRLKHLPLQLSFTLHDIQSFDTRYDDPNAVQEVNIFGEDSTAKEKKYTVDKIAQHLNVAGEFYFGKNVMVRVGYDHMTRKEMSVETRRGLTGFSMGFGMKINKYSIDYGHEFYSLAGGSHHITLAANLNELFK